MLSPQAATPKAKLLAPRAAAQHMQNAVTVGTLAKWRCAGTGPAFIRIGNKIFYEESALDAYLQSRRVQPAAA